MRATLPSRFALALDARAPRRSLNGASAAPGPPVAGPAVPVTSAPTASSASVTSSGPIGQALLEKVSAVSSKLESIMGRSDVRRARSRPMTSRPQSLGEKLMELTERLGHLDELLEDFQRQGAFRPPQRRAATPLGAHNVPVAVAVPPVAVGATPRAETQLVEASVKAVARSLLDAARHRSPSASLSYHSQFTPIQPLQAPVQMVRNPSTSRSTTPAATSRVRSPSSMVSTSMGLTPPPGLFIPSGFATPLTPSTPGVPGVPGPGMLGAVPGAFGPFTFESLAQNACRHLNGTHGGTATPRHTAAAMSPKSRSTSVARVAPPRRPEDEAEMKLRRWLDTIPIGNGAERGWDDTQIRDMAAFANKNQLSHLPPEQLYQRYVEHQVAEADKA